jgi:hypothetical protein
VTTLDQVRCGPGAVPLTGQQYQITAGQYRAAVTELGPGLRELLFATSR